MPLTVGPITQTLVGPTTASLVCAPATGGTGPYTYQWYMLRASLVQPATPFIPSSASLISGATSLTLLAQKLNYNTAYYFICQATDTGNSNLTANSVEWGLVTAQQANMLYSNPGVGDFQNKWFRDFPFDSLAVPTWNIDQVLLPADVMNAFLMVNTLLKVTLFLDQPSYLQGYFLLAAHYLCINSVRASQGINGQYNELQASKGVGPASESFTIPELWAKNPLFAGWAKTNYGRDYLNMIVGNLAGPMSSAFGQTKP